MQFELNQQSPILVVSMFAYRLPFVLPGPIFISAVSFPTVIIATRVFGMAKIVGLYAVRATTVRW